MRTLLSDFGRLSEYSLLSPVSVALLVVTIPPTIYLPQLSILHCYCTGRAVEANIDAPCSKCFWQSNYCNGCFNHLIVLVLYSIPYWSIINLQGCISFSLNSSWVNVNILCIKWRIKNQWNTFQICVSSNYFSSFCFFLTKSFLIHYNSLNKANIPHFLV